MSCQQYLPNAYHVLVGLKLKSKPAFWAQKINYVPVGGDGAEDLKLLPGLMISWKDPKENPKAASFLILLETTD